MELIFLTPRQNRYSINALVGAVEGYLVERKIPVHFCHGHEEVIELVSSLPESTLKVVCLSFFSTQVWEVEGLIERLKGIKRLVLVAGGPHPTGRPLETLEMGVDYVVRGEGERVFQHLIACLWEGARVEGIKGLVFRKADGSISESGKAEPVDLNSYRPFSARFSRYGPIEITRGCPFGCHYCQTPRIFSGPIRHRSVDRVLEVVRERLERGIGDIRFITPNALSYGSPDGREVSLESIEVLLGSVKRLLGKRGRVFFGSFPSEVRPEQLTPEVLELLKGYVDNDNLVIGAQSGSDRILRLCHRGHTVEDVYRAVREAIRYGFKANVDFIFSLPGETEKDIEETERFILELVSMGARVHAHSFMPLPQTPFSNCRPEGLTARYRGLINRLLPRGVIFGDWQKQAVIAQRLYQRLQGQGRPF